MAASRQAEGPTVHSHCVQVRCKDIVKEAISIFSKKYRNGSIPLVLIPGPRNALSLMLEVPSGCTCLMQKWGKDVGVAAPGLHVAPSWYRIAYVVSNQACTYDAPVQECPTSDDVRVNIDVVLVFRITDAEKFVYKLGAKNFDEFLTGAVNEAIRMLVRKQTHKDVYDLRGDRAQLLLDTLNDKFSESGVTFSDVKITSVWLPQTLAKSLEGTTMMEKAMEKLRRQNEFELLQINQESEMQIKEIKRRSEQVLVSESGRKRRAELEFEQRSVKAEEDARIALIQAEGKAEVMMLEVQTQLDRTKTQLETYRVQEIAKAEGEAGATKIKAELQAEQEVIKAGWMEEKMKSEAEATKFEASAEKEASRCLVAKRKHDMDLREKAILAGFAKNGDFNLVGTAGDKLISAMMTGKMSTK
jgi:regulator of protease activity HflC (stomatin/prohibitin superfamily)